MTTLLLLTTSAMAWDYWWANNRGPGTSDDRNAGIAGSTGEPYKGYHIATRDPSKSWDAMIACKDGKERKNQYIAKDAPDGTAAINIDPANGVYGTGENPMRSDKQNYDFTDNLFCIPDTTSTNNPNKGYPSKPVQESYVSVLQTAGADLKDTNGSADGLVLTKDGKSADGYNKLAGDNDYMLLVFCAKWCAACEDFRPRFEQYYKKQKATGASFDAVYFSNDNSAEEFQNDSYSCAKAPFDQDLADKLERVLGKNEVPCVIVVNKKGETLTTDGVNAIKGLSHKGTYPAALGNGAEFFADAPILPNANDEPCRVDAGAQRHYLKKRLDAEADAMTHDQLVTEANKVKADGETIPTATEELRTFVKSKLEAQINDASDEQVQQLYAIQEEQAAKPSQYKFKVGDYIRIKSAFTSDPERPGSATSAIPATAAGKANVGQVQRVGSAASGAIGAPGVDGSIQVKCQDNTFARRWILPEHFSNIEMIPASEANM